MKTVEELIEEHGTIEEFTSAVESAFNDGFCSWKEKEDAIIAYAIELSNAEVHNTTERG